MNQTKKIVCSSGEINVKNAVFMRRPVIFTPRLMVDNLNYVAKKRNFSIYVQTATIIYKKVDGIKLNRTQRRDITWHSNMDLIPNMCNLLKKMSIDIEVIFDKKIIPKKSIDRKELAFFCWKNINYSLINNLYK